MIKIFRLVALLEGVSFLFLLIVAMPLKYMYDMPVYVKTTGMAHGVLFIAYILLVIIIGANHNWNWKNFALAFAASILPFGTFYADKKLFREL